MENMIKKISTSISIIAFIYFITFENYAYCQRRNLDIYRESQRAQLVTGNAMAWSPVSNYLAVGYKDKVFILKPDTFKIIKTCLRIPNMLLNISTRDRF